LEFVGAISHISVHETRCKGKRFLGISGPRIFLPFPVFIYTFKKYPFFLFKPRRSVAFLRYAGAAKAARRSAFSVENDATSETPRSSWA